MVSKMAVKVSFQFNIEFSDVGQHIRACLMSTVTVCSLKIFHRAVSKNGDRVAQFLIFAYLDKKFPCDCIFGKNRTV